ncbi:hypothetical protein C4H11_04730 [Bacteroides zoogleoformans]|uniref:Phage tail tape measure protein n=1 Tax=Bacteroides zoogleoformans TaxID=28119 RepID=A0ABN5IJF9_9BACE|nr:hypothetical protein C4H11_04730 [Bacteroides zoogleoformans]
MSEDHIKWILSLDASDADKEIHKITERNKELQSRNKELAKSIREVEFRLGKESREYKTLSAQYKKNTEKLTLNRLALKKLEDQQDLNNLSMTSLKRRAQDLQKQLDNTSQALHPDQWNKLNRKLTDTKERMSQLKDSGKELESQFMQAAKSTGKWTAFFGNLYMQVAKWGLTGLGKLKELAAEGVEMAEAADGVKRAFDRLDDGSILDNLRKATKGTVTDLDLMKATVQAKDFRIPLEDLGKYLQFAQLKAQQTGQSVEYMTNSIITGLGRKSVMILDNLGLSAAEINEQVSKTGDFMSAVASIVDKQLAAAGENYVSASDRAQAATVRFQNAQLRLGQTLLPLKEGFKELYTGASIGVMNLIGWSVKHYSVLLTLLAAYLSYRAAVRLATTETYKNATATKASILLDKIKLAWINNTKGATLLYAAAKSKLAGNTLKANAAMKLFNKTCKANLIGLLVAGIVAGASAFLLFRKRTDEVMKITKEANSSIAEERNNLESLKKILFDSSKGYDQRKWALDRIQEMVPDYHASLTKEGELINNADALDLYVQKLLITAKQQAANAKLREALEARDEWYSKQDKGTALKMKEVEWGKNDMQNQGKSEAEVAASVGVSPSAFRAWSEQKKKVDNDVKRYEDMMRRYAEELANISNKYSSVTAGSSEKGDLVALKKKEIEEAEKVVATTRQEVAARNRKVAVLKAELEALQNLGVRKKKG